MTYNWKTEAASTSPHTGFIAQEVQTTLPDLISKGPDGYYTMNYAGLTPYIVKALQDIATITGAFKDNVVAWLGSAGNGITDIFATHAHFSRTETTTLVASSTISNEVDVQKLCTTRSDGVQVCVTNSPPYSPN